MQLNRTQYIHNSFLRSNGVHSGALRAPTCTMVPLRLILVVLSVSEAFHDVLAFRPRNAIAMHILTMTSGKLPCKSLAS